MTMVWTEQPNLSSAKSDGVGLDQPAKSHVLDNDNMRQVCYVRSFSFVHDCRVESEPSGPNVYKHKPQFELTGVSGFVSGSAS